MKVSDSIDTVMALAAREAIGRHFAEIEPDHLLLGLLRMAQLTAPDVLRLGLDEKTAAAVRDEVAELTTELARHRLEPAQTARLLGDLVGKGTTTYGGGRIHRSPECRRVFDRGAALARVVNATFRAVHLLQALLARPTPLLAVLLPGEPAAAKDAGPGAAGQKPGQENSPLTPSQIEALLRPDEPPAGTGTGPRVHDAKKRQEQERTSEPEPGEAKNKAEAPGAAIGAVPAAGDLDHLARLTACLRSLRADLQSRIFGQDHAIEAFIEGLFNAEITASVDTERRAPRALFVFAGPPGVGKTYLAETGAAALKRPFKRFDMSAFAGHHQGETLVGIPRNYQGAQPGLLTGFVDEHPDAVLLFDEIEKAHVNTIHYFLQLLDAGRLEDKFHSADVAFRDTTIIFTTNVGRKLYDNPDRSGVNTTNAMFHRRTIIDALATEVNPATREPFFPEAICSRMATGYPVLFNHLGVNELVRVAQADAGRTADLLATQLGKKVTLDEAVPLLLVMKEGGRTDARTLRAQAGAFVKNELFKVARLFADARLGEAMRQLDAVRFEVDADQADLEPAIGSLLRPLEKPRVLVVGGAQLAETMRPLVPDIDWCFATSAETAVAALTEAQPDFALVDLWLGTAATRVDPLATAAQFDHVPPAARGLGRGQELLRRIHERAPTLPVVLLVFSADGETTIDDELLAACVRAGGAREALTCSWAVEARPTPATAEQLRTDLLAVARRLAREKSAAHFARERKVLTFDTAPRIDEATRSLRIRLRNLRLGRAVAAADAGEILEDVERPRTSFADVIGADSAKEELRFFIDYLKNPRRFVALGLKPPKGILLYGPPGTGKTMLARAMAGESDVAYIPAAASSFVTMWQGSGPESVRKLFARARRYAPAIVFIDEIDAVGKMRTGSPSGHGEEMALNALLTEMDGFSGQSADRPVFVLAATNFRVDVDEADAGRTGRALDPALVRRFSRSILVDLPDTAARRRYFVLRLGDNAEAKVSDGALDLLAEKSVGMSIAKLEQVLEAAGRVAFKNNVPMGDDLLLEALDTVREGEPKEWSPDLLEGTAWHEAGHTLMYWLAGWWSPEVSIVARASRGGGMRRAGEEYARESRTRSELLAEIRTALGGRVAEMIRFGDDAGLTTGASGDLDHACGLARQIICRYGMDEKFGPVAMNEMLQRPEALGTPLYREIQQRVAEILRAEEGATRAALTQHRADLERVATALIKRNRLLRADLELLLGAPPSLTPP